MVRFSTQSAHKAQSASLYAWAHANPPETKGMEYVLFVSTDNIINIVTKAVFRDLREKLKSKTPKVSNLQKNYLHFHDSGILNHVGKVGSTLGPNEAGPSTVKRKSDYLDDDEGNPRKKGKKRRAENEDLDNSDQNSDTIV